MYNDDDGMVEEGVIEAFLFMLFGCLSIMFLFLTISFLVDGQRSDMIISSLFTGLFGGLSALCWSWCNE